VKSTFPVTNVPFCTKTTSNKVIRLLKRSPNSVIIDVDSKTVEAPYSDTFSVKELWVFLSLPEEQIGAQLD